MWRAPGLCSRIPFRCLLWSPRNVNTNVKEFLQLRNDHESFQTGRFIPTSEWHKHTHTRVQTECTRISCGRESGKFLSLSWVFVCVCVCMCACGRGGQPPGLPIPDDMMAKQPHRCVVVYLWGPASYSNPPPLLLFRLLRPDLVSPELSSTSSLIQDLSWLSFILHLPTIDLLFSFHHMLFSPFFVRLLANTPPISLCSCALLTSPAAPVFFKVTLVVWPLTLWSLKCEFRFWWQNHLV